MLKKAWQSFLPLLMIFFVLFLLWHSLGNSHQPQDSQLVGKPFPSFSLPSLYTANKKINETSLKGNMAIVNVWASWCYACELEQQALINISRRHHIPIFGVNYKDKPENAINWLASHGNPFSQVVSDRDGELAIDLGIYGTPETFIVSKQGRIIYRHTGVIDEKTFEEVILPVLQKYQT